MGSWSNDLEDTEATPVPTTSSEICSSLNKLLLDVNSKVLFRDCRSVVRSRHVEETQNTYKQLQTHTNTTQLERKCCRNSLLI